MKFINEEIPANVQLKGISEAPDLTYKIDHIYGFAGDRSKSCLSFGKDNNEIVFMAAAIGVVQDLQTNTQKFFGGLEKDKMQKKYENHWPVHQDDIADLAVCHEQRNIIATGEVGKKSTIHIWDTNTMESLGAFNLWAEARGVTAISISPCARYVCCVDNSNDHNLTIYNINRKKLLIQVSAGSDAITELQWSKKVDDLRFCAVTSRSLQFWNPADSSKKLFKNGSFGPKFTQTKFLCAAFDENGVCYSGGENGAVHCWD